MNLYTACFLIAYFLISPTAHCFDGLVEKKTAQLNSFITASGETIQNVQIGYESYGKLASDKHNVILVEHYFSGTSHAAGRYAGGEKPGYWDSIIGPGLALDTKKYFVISSDTLTNINAKSPQVISTGPASINPSTGKPYGMSFPALSLHDFVAAQKALLQSLGIDHLYAVVGASSGAMQSMQWASDYPNTVDRVIAVIGPGTAMPKYGIAMLHLWSMPILLDSHWAAGDYYGKEEPQVGLMEALQFVHFSSSQIEPYEQQFSRDEVGAGLQKIGEDRARFADANSFLYTARAIQGFNVEANLQKIRAKILFISAESDLIFPPVLTKRAAKKLRAIGKKVSEFMIVGDGGHLDGLNKILQAAPVMRAFLQAK